MEQEVKVSIERGKEIKVIFYFSNELILNLSSDSTTDTQDFFLKLLNELIENPKEINFKLEDENNDLYHDITEKYLRNLETEIKKIIINIPKKL